MTLTPNTHKANALIAVYEADKPVSAKEVRRRMETPPTDASVTLKRLFDDQYLYRQGDGVSGDPYKYVITPRGESAVADLRDGFDHREDDDKPTGLDALFEADGDTFDYVSLSNDAEDDDVRFGTRYYATVNNTKGYGFFVSLNEAAKDVTGLVHKSDIPNLYTPDDFAPGDKVGVMLSERSSKGLNFELVASIDTARDIEFEKPPSQAPEEPVGDDAEVEAVEVEDTEEVDDVAEAIDDLRFRLDTVEEGLHDLEDVFGNANIEREDARYRLRQIEDAIGDADHVVGFGDREFVECLIMVSQSNYGSTKKKRHVVSTLLGIEDREDKGLLSRALASGGDSDDTEEKAALFAPGEPDNERNTDKN